jgi:hypothetical protein
MQVSSGKGSRCIAGVQIVMVIAQSALLWWKKRHKRSYEGVRRDALMNHSVHECLCLHVEFHIVML